MKKVIIYTLYALIALVAISGAVMAWNHYNLEKAQKASPSVDNADIVLFYGSTCPHCKVVEDYLATNDVKSKVPFSEKEVYGNKSDAKLMMDRQTACGISKDNIGAVPFLWTKNGCYLGQEEIIKFFSDKLQQGSQGASNNQ